MNDDTKTPDEIIEDFRKKFFEKMEDLDPEFQKVIDDNYWDLITDTDIPDKSK